MAHLCGGQDRVGESQVILLEGLALHMALSDRSDMANQFQSYTF